MLITALGLLTSPAFAAAAGDLTPAPAQIDFGTQDIHAGSTNSQSVALENLTGEPLSVSSVSIAGVDAGEFFDSNGCGFVNEGESCSVSVSFDPALSGLRTAQLEIVDDNGTVVVPLSGSGATGTLSGSSPGFNVQPYYFGDQQQNVNASNNSAFAVAGTNATISGPDAGFFSIGFNGCQFVLQPGNNCSVGVNFSPTGAGTKDAQLELTNDGTNDPLVIPLSATALAGPNAVITPSAHDFGDVAVGSTSPRQTLTVSNTGDFPLQIQQLLVLSGAPLLFPTAGDSCNQQTLGPGASCQFVERFQPTATGSRDATIFVITNQNGPVVTSTLTGSGVPLPRGVALLLGSATAGSPQSCVTRGYSEGTSFAFQWLRDGQPIAAATSAQFTPRDTDVGSVLACRVEATNSVGSETVTSLPSAPIAPRALSQLSGSIVGAAVCREVQAPSRLRVGATTVTLGHGRPITPEATLRLDAPGLKMSALIDGQSVGSGKGKILITPRALQRFGDGGHTLQISSNQDQAQVQIALAPCQLAATLEGGKGRATNLTISTSAGMREPSVRLPDSLRIRSEDATLGTASIQVSGEALETFSLFGPRTTSNGITVLLLAHSIKITHLPPEVGVVSIRLNEGVVSGRGGRLKAKATVRGAGAASSASGRAVWRR